MNFILLIQGCICCTYPYVMPSIHPCNIDQPSGCHHECKQAQQVLKAYNNSELTVLKGNFSGDLKPGSSAHVH